MKKQLLSSLALLASLALMNGCGSSGNSTAAADAPATQPARPIPPDSPFAKVKVGMGQNEVFATIGQPASMDHYVTGKAFIPFHYSGSDNTRMAAHYKGQGIITFSQDSAYTSGFSVVEIDYDPNEPGFAK